VVGVTEWPLGPAGDPGPADRAGDGDRDPARDAGGRGAAERGRSTRDDGRGAVPVGSPSKSRAVPQEGQYR
jgi:hypothetical protein